ncbi:type VII secretion integral membrane protein EccD [Micromonospora sp. NPDC093277]|uniref:type VII secretion integral membrane protein EccD n=1 Tax=Micromonospora sp. NPDC093277 TaxID=3364291 RepID=UPI003810C264
MTTTSVTMTRLVVAGPRRRIDIAVPADVVVADLLPALLHHLGEELADAGLAHGGWILQRLGEAPFDEQASVGSLALRDGETVFLRPQADQIPPVHFDDVIDGVATAVSERSGLWRPEMVPVAAVTAAAVAAAVSLVVLALPGPAADRSLVAAVLGLLSLVGAFAYARGLGDRRFGVLSAATATAAAALAGLTVPDLMSTPAAPVLGGAQTLAGSTAAAIAAVLAGYLAGHRRAAFVAVAAAAAFGALGGGLTVAGLSGAQSAGVVAVVATLLVVSVPLAAARLARIRLAPLPTKPEHLQEDIDPEPSAPLLARGAGADRGMTALYAGGGAATAVALVVLAAHGGWAAVLLVVLVAVARLLMIRPMTSAWHRLAVGLPAVLGLAAVAVAGLAGASSWVRLGAGLGLAPGAVLVLFLVARALGERRPSPYWGRAGDLLQLLSTVALVPVLLQVMGVYAVARGLGG